MKRNHKWILGSILTLIIATSGSLMIWFLIIGNQPPDEDPNFPDLIVADYTLDNDYLTVNITNIGDESATSVSIVIKIDTLDLVLYNISNSPIDLGINEDFIISINLTDFEHYFVSLTTYSIKIQVDPEDVIEEILENNNEEIIDYNYESQIFPISDLLPANTFSLNSTIDTFAYAVQFNATQITLQDSLTITNASINGYQVINSTILTNSTIANENVSISIALHGNQSLIMKNIWNSKISVVVNDNSSLSLQNCSIDEISVGGNNDVLLYNSTIDSLNSANNLSSLFSLRITNHSRIENCVLTSINNNIEIDDSSFNSLYLLPAIDFYAQEGSYSSFGKIEDCSIYNLYVYSLINIDVYRTNITQFSIVGKSRVNFMDCIIGDAYVNQNARTILNNTRITDQLNYGIKVYSGSVNITDGVIHGSTYENNTLLINADVFEMRLATVTVNNTGNVIISNTSCNLFLYNSAQVTVNESNLTVKRDYGAYLQDSSKLIGINSHFSFLLSQDNSSLDIKEDSTISSLFINTTNDVKIVNCTLDEVRWETEPLGNHKAQIINSTIDTLNAPPSSRIDIINCSIAWLNEGIRFQTGMNFLNSSGSYGTSIISDYLNITDSVITNRALIYLEIMGDATVSIEDLRDQFAITAISGNLTMTNCTLASMELRNDAIVYIENCSSTDTGGLMFPTIGIHCIDNSRLYVNNTSFARGPVIILDNTAEALITNSEIAAILITGEARAIISNCVIGIIRVSASSSTGYALTISYSSTDYLLTISWKMISNATMLLFLLF